ncbi:MAG TPA: hypothetical protein VFK21_13360 [Gammaproteobacteria bacterium]|nr:hypothetical protein [Gammaproteobacteria bacterium]
MARNRRIRHIVLSLALGLLPLAAGAMPSSCADPAYKQFDFWLGDWNVTTPDGKLVGRDHVEKLYGGCVLKENWTGLQGGSGSSFNIYDAPRKLWHQSWVDSMGTLLVLEGGLKDGRMVLSGDQVQKDGSHLLNRLTWAPQDGRVRQTWDVSKDGGKTWKIVFDGIYKKAN